MFENEVDSDDDFEGYFLKPVNEYNIVDKIKEANKELFSTPEPHSPLSSGIQRRVTFRAVLEDYEPNEQYAVEIDIASITTEEGFVSDIHQFDCENAVIMEKSADSTKELDNVVPEIESENEIEEICEEVFDLDLQQTQVEISENLQENLLLDNIIHGRNSDTNNYSAGNSERRGSVDDSSRTSDDDLSLIVASYITDDTKRKFHDDDDDNIKSTLRGKCKRRFSVKSRKKDKIQDGNDALKLNLNYKTCCEYKNATNEQLPKYTGYLSTYGLSKEQWERREKLLDKKQNHLLEKNIRATEEDARKMQDNERAFTNWLKNKMRFPINKTKNMFDFKQKKQKNKCK